MRVKSVYKVPIAAQHPLMHTQQCNFKKQRLKTKQSLPYFETMAVPELPTNQKHVFPSIRPLKKSAETERQNFQVKFSGESKFHSFTTMQGILSNNFSTTNQM